MDCDQPGSSIHGIPQEYWSGLPFASPGNLPHPGIQLVSLRSNLQWQVGSLPLAPLGKPKKWGRGDGKGGPKKPHSPLFVMLDTILPCFTYSGDFIARLPL